MENQNATGQEIVPVKQQKPVFNADFAFIAITTAALYSYALVYSLVFLA
jgi:hypothetical protein